MLAAKTVNLRPSLSPPPSLPLPAKVSYLPDYGSVRKKSNGHAMVKPNAGDAMLVAVLDGGRNPDIAATAAIEALPSDDESESQMSEDCESLASQDSESRVRHGLSAVPMEERDGEEEAQEVEVAMSTTSTQPAAPAIFDLKSLAAGALAFTTTTTTDAVNAGPTPPVTENDVGILERRPRGTTPAAIVIRNDVPHPEDRPVAAVGPAAYSPYSPNSLCSPRDGNLPNLAMMDLRSPTAIPGGKGELPPIQLNSPRSDTNGQTSLPSIRAQLGDLGQLQENAMGRDGNMMHPPAYPHSPPGTFPPMAMQRHQGSPPVSPAETFHRGLPSPRHPHSYPHQAGQHGQQPLAPAPPLSSPLYNNGYPQLQQQHLQQRPRERGELTNGFSQSPGSDAGSGEGPVGDRMSIDGLTTTTGWFICPYVNCNAAPFQTQYLLNSHANVHSSARPHFCPVKGCPRSEGGKGFKRKNEMIRHGLVHDSPGYVCPFCPDREHKYPRPDNLQR